MTAEIAAFFPDSFQDSELGPIPQGWEVSGLDSLGMFLNGLALQKYRPGSETYLPVIKIAQLRAGFADGREKASPDIDPKYVVRDDDVIFSWSGSLMNTIWCGGDGALNQHLFKVTSEVYPKWFYFQWINEHLPEFQDIASDKATTMGHIQRHHLTEAKVVIPRGELLPCADRIFSPLLNQYILNTLENRTLGKLRDSLLPKLMSGEIRLRQAEQ